MKNGWIEVICGSGRGKTALAMGKGLTEVADQKSVIMIQFLRGCDRKEEGQQLLQRLEPEFKIFRFEKADAYFDKLSEEEKAEELINIRNGFNFAKKVIATGECDLLILDEVLEIVNQNIVSLAEFENFLRAKTDDMCLLLTGTSFPEELKAYVNAFSVIDYIQVDKELEE